MSTAVQIPATQWESRELIDTLKQTVCKGATDAQFRMFVEVCKTTGLNPFLKEIYFVPSVGVMAGRDGYLRVANEHPQFDGMETRVDRDDKGIPIKATCSVWRKDRGHPITTEAYYSEYKKGGTVWQTYPSAMISKVAEVLALKRSFAIHGVVTEEEIGTTEERGSKEAQQEVKDRRIKELSAPTITVTPEVITELADFLDTPPDEPPPIEMKPKRKRGDISFDTLKHFKDMKKLLKEASDGTDTLYYEALKAAGVAHADELSTVAGRAVYKSMLAVHNRLKQDKALRLEVETHALRIGAEKFARILGANGFSDIDEFMANATGPQTDGLLKDLKDA